MKQSRYKLMPALATASVLLFSGGSFLVQTPAALAAGTLYVGHGATDSSDSSCDAPGYNSVQAAVNAAAVNETVYLCGAQFKEQVFVNKKITLTGDTTSGLTSVGTTFSSTKSDYPAKFTTDNLFLPQALLVTTGNVTVNYLTISGPLPGNGGCAEKEYGVLALGGTLNMFDDSVLNIADTDTSLEGCQFGVGIQVGAEYWPSTDFSSDATPKFAAKATLNDVTVSGYAKNGITIDSTGSSATIYDSTVTGNPAAPFGNIVAQNGIQISRGATGTIKYNTINNNAYSGDGFASSTGILVYGGWGVPLSKNVHIFDNTLSGNDVGIALANYNSDGSGAATSPTNDEANDNMLSNSAVTNVSGLCDGSSYCGGELIGYQAGVQDIGRNDDILDNMVSGNGYASQGTYKYTTNPAVFTQTGPNQAFVRDVDAGGTIGSFYDNNPNVHNNMFY
jgi:Right handed beta helix region